MDIICPISGVIVGIAVICNAIYLWDDLKRAAYAIFITIVLISSLAMFIVGFDMKAHEIYYREGQLDYIEGKIKYKKVIVPTTQSVKYEEIK